MREPLAQRFGVTAGRELGGNEQCDHAARPHQLEGALGERHRKIGEMGEAAYCGGLPA